MFRILYVLGWFFFWVCRDMAWKLIVGWICCQILKFDRFHYLPFVKVLLQILHHIACSIGSNWTFANLVQLSLFLCDFLGQCWFTCTDRIPPAWDFVVMTEKKYVLRCGLLPWDMIFSVLFSSFFFWINSLHLLCTYYGGV